MTERIDFSTWRGEGWVTITLIAGSEVGISTYQQTDEGFSRESITYSYDGEAVTRTVDTTARGCDGLRSTTTEYTWDTQSTTTARDGVIVPVWVEGESSVYDQYAQLAGY